MQHTFPPRMHVYTQCAPRPISYKAASSPHTDENAIIAKLSFPLSQAVYPMPQNFLTDTAAPPKTAARPTGVLGQANMPHPLGSVPRGPSPGPCWAEASCSRQTGRTPSEAPSEVLRAILRRGVAVAQPQLPRLLRHRTWRAQAVQEELLPDGRLAQVVLLTQLLPAQVVGVRGQRVGRGVVCTLQGQCGQ